MKKIFMIFILIFALLLGSCGNSETLTSTTEMTDDTFETTQSEVPDSDLIDVVNCDEYYYYGFDEIENDTVMQQQKASNDLTNYLIQEKLSFDDYEVYHINVTYYKNENDERTGKQTISMELHKKDCDACKDVAEGVILHHICKAITIYIYYDPEGVKRPSDDFEKTSVNKDNYVAEFNYFSMYHVYMINDNCKVRFTIKSYDESYDEIVEKADAYADYLREVFAQTGDEVK